MRHIADSTIVGGHKKNVAMKLFQIVLTISLLCSFSAYAAEGSRLGYGLSLNNLTVEDPDGDVPSTTDLGFLNFYYIDALWRDTRYYAEFVYFKSDIDAEVNKIGQDVSSTGMRAVFQKRLRLGRHFKPWVGVGAGVFQEAFTLRHTVDSAGFLLTTYPDRDATSVVFSVDAVNEWQLTDRFDLGVRLLYALPLENGTRGLSATAMLLYKGF